MASSARNCMLAWAGPANGSRSGVADNTGTDQQLQEVDGGIGSLVHQGLLQEALLDGRVSRQLVEQLQGGGGHAQKARPCAALLLIEAFLGSAFPAGK